ncbi:hypothetical protein MBLNU230_g8630t1 [Neophaeotheca triangularis]
MIVLTEHGAEAERRKRAIDCVPAPTDAQQILSPLEQMGLQARLAQSSHSSYTSTHDTSSGQLSRQWFVPGEGIDQHVISADVQRYLGDNATARPGMGNGSYENFQGYWIKAHRNLTTDMIADLKRDSARWRQEQRVTGTREPYVGSATHKASVWGRHSVQESLDPREYPPTYHDRPPSRYSSQPDARQYAPDPRDPRDQQRDPRYSMDPQAEFRSHPINIGTNVDPRYPDGRSQMSYGRPPMTSSFQPDSGYATAPGSIDGPPPGYVRPGNYYVPMSQPADDSSAAVRDSQYRLHDPYQTRDPREDRSDDSWTTQ